MKLQIDALWEDCFTDADIKHALKTLPRDLDETYRRCIARITTKHQRYTPQILSWIASAKRPFKHDELQEALALDPETGCLDHSKMPSRQWILQCGVGLITRDDEDQIVFAHHSVRKFLADQSTDDRIWLKGLGPNAAVVALGELCVKHLSSDDYSRSLQPLNSGQRTSVALRKETVETLLRPVPKILRRFLQVPQAPRLTLLTRDPIASSSAKKPAIFDFARDHWAILTRHISRSSACWQNFVELTIQPNNTWPIHPWKPMGLSVDSHYSGLLGWATANEHLPMLDILLEAKPRAEIFKLPLYEFGNRPALHVASSLGNTDVVALLQAVCKIRLVDNSGRTALHYASEMGHMDMTLFY